MDLSGHRTKFPVEISEYFYSSWLTRELWRLDVPRKALCVEELVWHLDWPFLSSHPPAPLFDLKPRTVLSNPEIFTEHWRRVLAADLSFPVAVQLKRASRNAYASLPDEVQLVWTKWLTINNPSH